MTSRSKRIPTRVLSLMTASNWAVREEALQRMMLIARRDISTDSLMAFDDEPMSDVTAPPTLTVRDGVAIIPFIGPGFRYASLMTDICGAASYERLAMFHRQALADPSVKAILFEINSPGGEVTGCADLARQIRDGCAIKPTVAFIDGDASSAAYWVASACDHIVIASTGTAGCLGVVAMFQDRTRADEIEGIENIEIVSSQTPNKRPDLTTDAGRSQIQRSVDATAAIFLADVGRYRGVPADQVARKFGRGDVEVGANAVKIGLADEVGTYDEVLALLSAKDFSNSALLVANSPPNIGATTVRGSRKSATRRRIRQ